MSLTELARLSNVSVTTASRALSGKGRVAPGTRERVLTVSRRLGYRPSVAGRALVTGKTGVVGMVMERAFQTRTEWGLRIQAGLSEALEASDRHLMVFHAEPTERRLPSMVLGRAVDGIVIVLSGTPAFLEELRLRGTPVVVVDPAAPVACDRVRADEVDGARQATRHLLELGHRKIAYIGIHTRVVEHVSRQRWSGYVEVMSSAGLPVNPGGDAVGPVDALLARALDWAAPTAFVCFNDFVATEAVGRLRERGIDVPRDASVLGFDDMSYLARVRPRQTTVAIPYEEMGAKAADLILERIDAPDLAPREIILPEQLIVRDSTAPAPSAPAP